LPSTCSGFPGRIDDAGFTEEIFTEENMALKQGWTGRVYEDFEVGDVYQHPLGRTVLAADNVWFTLLTQNTNPIHFDTHYAAQTEFQKPLVDSTFTLALVTGQSVTDISQNAMANLGWDEVRLPNPLFEGDTVYSRSEVLEKRESKSRSNAGIVRFKTTGFKQDGTVVIEFKRTVLVYKRGHVPLTTNLPEPKL
jgi:itaconyl-CoA hydratase